MDKKREFEQLKQEYRETKMSKEQFASYRKAIAGANSKGKGRILKFSVGAAAAVFAAFLILPNTSLTIAYAMERIPVLGNLVSVVTFRDYKYDSERNFADVKIPEIVIAEPETEEDGQSAKKAQKSAEEINSEIQEISDKLIEEFKEGVKDQEGYQDIMVTSETLATTEEYFTLKLICYQGAGSGAEWDYFYTVDLETGERIALADLFLEGADYKKAISDNIKEQMKEQMAADENVMYWVDYQDMPDLNFETITDDTGFYVNDAGKIVIAFNEGDVAPMYMGCVEFVIDSEEVAAMRKE